MLNRKTLLILLVLNIGCVNLLNAKVVHLKTYSDLKKISNNPSYDYVLDNDIDCAPYTMFGQSYIVSLLSGTLDGQGHVIKNMKIHCSDVKDPYCGFIRYMNGGMAMSSKTTVKNLGFVNAEIIYGEHQTDIGTLAGRVINSKSIENCWVVNCTIKRVTSVEKGVTNVGSLVGSLEAVDWFCLSNCAALNNYIEGFYVGGICGKTGFFDTYSSAGPITSCCSYYNKLIKLTEKSFYTVGSITGFGIDSAVKASSYYGVTARGYKITSQGTKMFQDISLANSAGTTESFPTLERQKEMAVKYGGIFNYFTTIPGKQWFEMITPDQYTSLDGGAVDVLSNAYIPHDVVERGLLKTPSFLTIKNNASIEMENYQDGQTVFGGKTVVLEKKLPKETWTLIGNLSDTPAYEFLDANYGDKNTEKHHAFAVNAYDYATNGWYENYQQYTDNTPDDYGAFFAYPFAEELGSSKEAEPLNDDYVIVPQTISSGKVNLSTVTFETKNTGSTKSQYDDAKYFALSNPYIGRLSLKKFYDDNEAQIQSSYVWIYDNTLQTPDWVAVDVTKNIALNPATGFLVASALDNEDLNVIFNTTQLLSDETPLSVYKSDKTKERIRFVAESDGIQKEMFIHIDASSDNGFDRNDAYAIMSENENAVNPYFVVNNRRIFDNYISDVPYVCDINFNSYAETTVDFVMTEVINNVQVSIIDIEKGNKQTVLTVGKPYSFVVNEGSNEGRYKLKLSYIESDIRQAEIVDNDIQICNDGSQIKISGEELQNITVINTFGQTVYSQVLKGNYATTDFNGGMGVYIVRIQSQNGIKTKKIIIK